MNDLLTDLYRKMTNVSPDGRSTYCQCCGLTGSHVGPGRATLVKHMPDCELAKIYENAGGAVEWRGAAKV